MQINKIIRIVKGYCRGAQPDGHPIDDITTRDQVLWGATDRACTGIVTTCAASPNVIRATVDRGANLIICHEALFWNHGDRTGWLADDLVFRAKRALLDEGGITVWRFHDYIHSGIPTKDGGWVDGIFVGLAKKLGWMPYHEGDEFFPAIFSLPQTTAGELAQTLIGQLGLKGARLVGSPETPVSRVRFMGHAFGGSSDDPLIAGNAAQNVDCELALEAVDFTVAEYVRDASELGHPKALITLGHFDTEEPGMEHMVNWLPGLLGGDLAVSYVQSGGFSSYLTR